MQVYRKMDLLHPLVREKTYKMVDIIDKEGLNFALFETFRDPLRQFHLWSQGRLFPGKRVTKVPIGFHCLGLAVDFVLYHPTTKQFSGEYSWQLEGNEHKWRRLGEIGEEVGFFWGGRWNQRPDFPHFQLSGTKTVNEVIATKEIPFYDDGLSGMEDYGKMFNQVATYSISILTSINGKWDEYIRG